MKPRRKQSWHVQASGMGGMFLIAITGWQILHQPGAIATEAQILQLTVAFGLLAHRHISRK